MANCKIKRTYPANNKIENIKVDFEVVSPNKNKLKTLKTKILCKNKPLI